jgi:hypothetical protein
MAEGKLDLNTTIKASTKEYTWVYPTGKDSSKIASEINKKLNDLGIKSFISKTTGDTIAIPTKELKAAFDKVLSNYSNIKQFAYDDGTKNDKSIVNEFKTFESFLNEASKTHDYYALWNKHIMQIIKDLDLPSSYKIIDWPDLPKKTQEEVIKHIDKGSLS